MNAIKTVLIVDKLSKEALEILARESHRLQVREVHDLDLAGKLEAARGASGILVRSGTRIDRSFLEVCDRLEIVVRAGVGVDNIDCDEATRKGVVVQNVPEGNTRSAAEHTIAMLLALLRRIPQACARMKEGGWDRSQFVGTEFKGKTLGIVGLGKIGLMVHQMASCLGMKTLGFDPFISPKVAEDHGVPLAADLKDLVGAVDFLTVHVPLSPGTQGLISSALLARAKRGIAIVNCARGGIVDEAALLDALDAGIVGGAALDVFQEEPPAMSKLLRHPRVIATPHLGASTQEAQQNVAIAAAEQIVDYFVHRKLTSPVNAVSLDPKLREEVQPYFDLALHLGLLQAQLLEGNPSRIRMRFFGDALDKDLQRYLTAAALSGFLQDRLAQPVNAINAHHLASEMGLVVEESNEGKSRYFHRMLKVEVTDSSRSREVGGTIRGQRGLRLVSLDDYHFDAVLEGRLLMIKNEDRPGMIGVIGQCLASNNVNISYMSLGRDRSGGTAIALLNLDEPVPAGIAPTVESLPGVLWSRLVRLPDPRPSAGA